MYAVNGGNILTNTSHINQFTKYLKSNNKSKETIQSYTRTIKQFHNIINKKPEDINKKDIERYKYWANEIKHYDRNSLTPKYIAIKSYLEFLEYPDKKIKSFKLNPPRKEVKPKIPLTRQEVKEIFDAAEENLRDYAILKTLYYSTIRSRELCNLNISDIDFQRQKIRTISKGHHYDERNIHPDALKAIGHYLNQRPQAKKDHEHAIFLNSKGERIGRTFLHNMIKQYATKAKITKRVYPHLFRTSSITHMHNAGASIPDIMAQSRHRSVDTLLKHYINPSEEHNREIYLKTLSFNTNNDEQSQKTIKRKQPKQDREDNPSTIEQILATQLANGTITPEIYLEAVNKLKKEHENMSVPIYG